ncbi:MAG: putative protein YgaU [Candidatus Marinimicrobia bacterium]|nr:putative protein YgaU [Candidatus Neomarinimicrobiota bacterium]
MIDSLRAEIEGLQAKRDDYLREYVVKPGDYLMKISALREYYNDPYKWRIIYEANRDIIDDPDLIYPKQILKIPPVSENNAGE